jgi:gliding motility-associated-like protein
MRKFLLLSLIVFISVTTFSQDFSNKGKDFYLCFPSHVPNSAAGIPTLSIYVTSDQASTGTITMGNGAFSSTFNLTAGNNFFQEITISSATAQILNAESNVVGRKSIRVQTNPGQAPVVVYAQQWAGARSAATLVLPVNVLGKKYYAVSSSQSLPGTGPAGFLSKSHFQIIAINDNTTVQITPKYNGAKQSPFVINLPLAGDIYQYEPPSTATDITGSFIESLASGTGGCLPIAVFSGTSGVAIGAGACTSAGSSDPLFQQLYPTSTWGKNFGFIASQNYPTGNPYRIIASEDNTNVYLNGALTAVLGAGDIYPNTYVANPAVLSYATPTFINADKPISVAQFIQSNGCSGAGGSQGDPDMVVLNPIEQNIKDITVFSSSNQSITQRFLNVLIKTNATASFKINGLNPTTTWLPAANLPGYSYLRGEPFPGTGSYRIVADSGFNAIAYGYGANESYAYSAGTNVEDLSHQLEITPPYSIETSPNVCINTLFNFKVYLPNATTGLTPELIRYDSIRWDCSNSAALTPANFPVVIHGTPAVTPDSINIRNTRDVAWYSIPGQYSFNAPGVYNILVTVYRTTTEGCGNEQSFPFTITVTAPPTGSFSYINSGCYLEPVQFTETTPQTPKTTYLWNWVFGDPLSGALNTSIQRSPSHPFSGPGSYNVQYTAYTTAGCMTTAQQTIVIPDVPNATISATAATACINSASSPQVTFTVTGGTAPYVIDYKLNNIAQPSVISVTNTYTINVPTNIATTYTYVLDSVKNQGSTLCKTVINGQTATVTINPNATIAYQVGSGSTTQSVCINSPITPIDYLIGSGGTGGAFTITPALTGLTGSYNVATNIYTLQGSPTAAGTYTITIKPTGPCVDPLVSTTVTLTVNATATLSLFSGNANPVLCVNSNGLVVLPIVFSIGGGATNATVTGLPAGVTGTYNATTQKFTISGIPTTTVFPFTYNYSVSTVSTCSNPPPFTGSITVNPDAAIALQASSGTTTQTRCVNNSITDIKYDITGSVTTVNVTGLPPGVSFVYTPGTSGVLTISGTPTSSAGSPFNYTVVITGPCAVPATSQTGVLTVNPNAGITLQSATATPTVCINTPVSILYQVTGTVTTANLTGTLPPGVTFNYLPGNPGSITISGTPTSNAGSPFNYSIALTGPCQVPPVQSGSITVTGDATISAPTGPNVQTVCVNTAIATITYTIGGTATGALITGLPAGVTGTVTGNTITILGTPTVVAATPQTYNYSITVQGPCAIPLASTGSITVNPDHIISSPPNNNQTVCVNSSIVPIVYNFSGGANGMTVNSIPPGMIATFGPGTITVTGSPTASGTYSITTAGNACKKATVTGIITVIPAPTANFNYTTPTCDTRVITFTDNSTANAGTISGYSWNFGDPGSGVNNTSTAANPTHIFSTAGNHTVSLIVTTSPNSCSNLAFTRVVFVNERPHADFTVPVACITTNVLFPDASTGNNLDINGYKWSFGDPGSGPSNNTSTVNGQHIFSAAGTFTVMHITTTLAGCADTTTHTIFISSSPVADFTVNNATALCVNDTVSIVNKASIATGTIDKVEVYWDFLGAPGTFTVFNTPVLNEVYKHKYPNFQSPLTKQYSIRYRAFTAGLCVDEKTIVVTLNAVPKVQFNAMPDACYDAAAFQITQASETGGVPGTGVYSGPGVSPTGLFTPLTAGIGVHTIKYTFTSSAAGCVDTMSSIIRVLDTAHAVYSYVNPLCEGNAVTFKEESTVPGGVTLNNTTWNFGDGSPIEQHAPGTSFTHNFLPGWGNYTVTMFNTSAAGCKSTTHAQQVYINPNPVPAFDFVSTAGICLPNAAVSFANNSTIADASGLTYTWDFGDLSTTSSAQVPLPHRYNGAGPYTVTLTVRSSAPGGGCIKTTTKLVDFIHPQPKTTFNFSKPEVCIGQSMTVTDNTNGLDGTVQQWFWDFGDGIKRNTNPVTYTYAAANTYNVSLYTINSQGCNSDTLMLPFTVNPYPIVDAGQDAFVLEGGSYVLQPIVSNSSDYQYLWSPPTYLSSTTIANPTANIILDDIAYTLFVTGKGGCPAPIDKVFIKVLKGPNIPNTFTPNGDGINEKWLIKYLDTYPSCKVQVFTRTGQLVFESRGYKEPWNGTLNGKPLPFDTYYYIIEPGNGRKPLTGYVTIIK